MWKKALFDYVVAHIMYSLVVIRLEFQFGRMYPDLLPEAKKRWLDFMVYQKSLRLVAKTQERAACDRNDNCTHRSWGQRSPRFRVAYPWCQSYHQKVWSRFPIRDDIGIKKTGLMNAELHYAAKSWVPFPLDIP